MFFTLLLCYFLVAGSFIGSEASPAPEPAGPQFGNLEVPFVGKYVSEFRKMIPTSISDVGNYFTGGGGDKED